MITDVRVNHAVAVGVIAIDRRDRNRRSALAANVTTMSLQLLTPFGEPFAIPLTLAGVVEDGYRLVNGAHVAVEGFVRLERGFDRRYATEDDARGMQTRAMQFVVTHVREPRADEPVGTSLVQLRGQVLDPPVFVEHPQHPGVRLALVRFGVTMERPSGYPGSAIVRQERCQVTVAVETRTPDAELLYRRDNDVRVEGELDCVLISVPTAEDAAAVQRVKAQWAETRTQLAHDPREHEAAYRRYLGQLRRFADTPRWRVLAGHISAAGDATPISQGEARRQRRELQRERNERQVAAVQFDIAPERAEDEPEPAAAEEPAPRRRRKAADVVEVVDDLAIVE